MWSDANRITTDSFIFYTVACAMYMGGYNFYLFLVVGDRPARHSREAGQDNYAGDNGITIFCFLMIVKKQPNPNIYVSTKSNHIVETI